MKTKGWGLPHKRTLTKEDSRSDGVETRTRLPTGLYVYIKNIYMYIFIYKQASVNPSGQYTPLDGVGVPGPASLFQVCLIPWQS